MRTLKSLALGATFLFFTTLLGACESTEYLKEGDRESVTYSVPFHVLGLFDRDVETIYICNPECNQTFDEEGGSP